MCFLAQDFCNLSHARLYTLADPLKWPFHIKLILCVLPGHGLAHKESGLVESPGAWRVVEDRRRQAELGGRAGASFEPEAVLHPIMDDMCSPGQERRGQLRVEADGAALERAQDEHGGGGAVECGDSLGIPCAPCASGFAIYLPTLGAWGIYID